jgi:hypothetical protein
MSTNVAVGFPSNFLGESGCHRSPLSVLCFPNGTQARPRGFRKGKRWLVSSDSGSPEPRELQASTWPIPGGGLDRNYPISGIPQFKTIGGPSDNEHMFGFPPTNR